MIPPRALLAGCSLLVGACQSVESESSTGAVVEPESEVVVVDTADAPETLIIAGPCAGLAEGAACDDESVCTLQDHCVSGFCVGAEHVTCPPGVPCTPSYCDPVLGCTIGKLPDGAPCSAPCFAHGVCVGGACEGVAESAIACPEPDVVCVSSLGCDPATGGCTISEMSLACPSDSRCFIEAGEPTCLQDHPSYCRPCLQDLDCVDPARPERQHRCLARADGSGSFCGSACDVAACPEGASCDASGGDPPQCVPSVGTCECDPLWASLGLSTTCERQSEFGKCPGHRRCAAGGLTACDAEAPLKERCNSLDDNCDGALDEGLDGLCGPEGACCLPGGSCGQRFHQSCVAAGGRFGGVGVACSEAACGVAPGACCGLGCSQVLPESCAATYHGDGSSCSEAECQKAVPTGACCQPTGTCSVVTAGACVGATGFFAGDGVSCEAAACEPTGACCLPDKTCVVIAQGDCVDQGGQFSEGTACLGAACPIPKGQGACCSDAGSCTVITAEGCQGLPGQFLSGQACLGQCQGPALGACCNINGLCSALPVGECKPGLATWKGPPAMCPEACASAKGACCAGLFCYPELSEEQCTFVNGAWLGEGADCASGCP